MAIYEYLFLYLYRKSPPVRCVVHHDWWTFQLSSGSQTGSSSGRSKSASVHFLIIALKKKLENLRQSLIADSHHFTIPFFQLFRSKSTCAYNYSTQIGKPNKKVSYHYILFSHFKELSEFLKRKDFQSLEKRNFGVLQIGKQCKPVQVHSFSRFSLRYNLRKFACWGSIPNPL